jgi:hypothetical protein
MAITFAGYASYKSELQRHTGADPDARVKDIDINRYAVACRYADSGTKTNARIRKGPRKTVAGRGQRRGARKK